MVLYVLVEFTPPVINHNTSTVEQGTEGFIYTCVATGIPAPNIFWTAIDESSDLSTTLNSTNSLAGIVISTTLEADNMTESILQITQGSVYSMPTCVATNPNGTDSLPKFTEIGAYICMYSYVRMWYDHNPAMLRSGSDITRI